MTPGSVASTPPPRPTPVPPAPVESPFYPIDPQKFIVMSICTLGVYEAYWMYRCWERIRKQTGENISPFWRAVFGRLYCYYLFVRVRDSAKQNRIAVDWSPWWRSSGYLLFAFAFRLPGVLGLIGALSFTSLLPVLHTALAIRRSGKFRERVNDEFNATHVVVCILGGAFVLFAIVIRIAHTLRMLHVLH